MTRLRDLGMARFHQSLKPSEELLLNSAEAGTIAWCGSGDAITNFWDPDNDPASPAWGNKERVVRAILIEWLCLDPEARQRIHPNGIQLGAAQIQERLNISDSTISFRLRLTRCHIPKGLDLYFSRTETLNLLGSHFGPVSGRRLTVNGDLLLGGGSVTNGEINLRDAEVVRDFDCSGGLFVNAGGVAIRATGLRVGRHARLGVSHRRDGTTDSFKCFGEIDLRGSQVGGDLDCAGADLNNQTRSSISLAGARISGSAELSQGFRSLGTVDFSGVEIKGRLNCSGGTFVGVPAILGNEIKVGRSVLMMEGFTSIGEVDLGGAEVGGQLDCHAGWFSNPGGRALSLNGAHVGDSAIIGRSFVACGGVDLIGAEIGGQLDCVGASLKSPEGIALDLNGAKVRQDAFICSDGVEDLTGAERGEQLDCAAASPTSPGGIGPDLKGAEVQQDPLICADPDPSSIYRFEWGSLLLSEGQIDLSGAEIIGDLNCAGARLNGSGKQALTATSANIKQRILLNNDFRAYGEIDLTQCEAGEIVCSKCTLAEKTGKCFTGTRLTVSGSVTFNDANVGGVVNLEQAKIAGDALFNDVRFRRSKNSTSLYSQNALMFEPYTAKSGLDGNRMSIDGRLLWKDVKVEAETILHLQNATIGRLSDCASSWPVMGHLRIDECIYGGFDDELSEMPVQTRLEWLGLQPFSYKPQTYKQLADVFRRNGREGDAIAVLVERENSHRRALGLSLFQRITQRSAAEKPATLTSDTSASSRIAKVLRGVRRWLWDAARWAIMWPLNVLIGNGYRPLQAFWAGLLLVVCSMFVFSYGKAHRFIVPSDKDSYKYYFSCDRRPPPLSYRGFNSFVYSLETFLPFIELDQKKNWMVRSPEPNEKTNCLGPPEPRRTGWLLSHLRSYLWLHTVLGWFVASMFVAGVTGLVRRE